MSTPMPLPSRCGAATEALLDRANADDLRAPS
jgi:hypothetical protein